MLLIVMVIHSTGDQDDTGRNSDADDYNARRPQAKGPVLNMVTVVVITMIMTDVSHEWSAMVYDHAADDEDEIEDDDAIDAVYDEHDDEDNDDLLLAKWVTLLMLLVLMIAAH